MSRADCLLNLISLNILVQHCHKKGETIAAIVSPFK